MNKTPIEFKQNPKVVYLDTRRDITEEELDDWREGYPDIDDCKLIGIIRAQDKDDFSGNFAYSPLKGSLCLVHGYAGLYSGSSEGGRIMRIDSVGDLLRCIEGCEDGEVFIDGDGLQVVGHHHDGSNHYTVHLLTRKGEEYCNRFYDYERDPEIHHHLLETDGCLDKVDYYLY